MLWIIFMILGFHLLAWISLVPETILFWIFRKPIENWIEVKKAKLK